VRGANNALSIDCTEYRLIITHDPSQQRNRNVDAVSSQKRLALAAADAKYCRYVSYMIALRSGRQKTTRDN